MLRTLWRWLTRTGPYQPWYCDNVSREQMEGAKRRPRLSVREIQEHMAQRKAENVCLMRLRMGEVDPWLYGRKQKDARERAARIRAEFS